ncbi:CHASE domain-containing protein [Tepidamorphus sp. 3E244]|uniref:CHASE domain-containing sensor histidine kinase n=1 Tax=Tepidamorphus sp. 3E244 TaxID=3385498 RepID=UPI0038FC1C6B
MRGLSIHWAHWLVLAGSLVLTFLAWQFARGQVEAQIHQRFDRQAARTMELIRERMVKYEEALWGGVAMLHASGGSVDVDHWRDFAEVLDIESRFPGINGIGVIYRVLPQERDAFLARQHATRPDFAIHPTHNNGEYWPIAYVEPLETNAQAIGLDMAHEDNRFTAARKAMLSGTAQMTGPITLVQDAARTPGFLLFAPYYRGGDPGTPEEREARFVGHVYAPFITKNLLDGTLAQQNRDVLIRLADGGEPLFDELGTDAATQHDETLRYEAGMQMFGRPWRFEVVAGPDFRAESGSHQPAVILAGGIIIDSLLFAIFFLLSRSNRLLAKGAENAHAKLQQNEMRMQSIVAGLTEGVATIDREGNIIEHNEAFNRIFGLPADREGDWNLRKLLNDRSVLKGLLRDAAAGTPGTVVERADVTGVRKDGTLFPLELSVSGLEGESESGLILLARDVSERHRAEAESRRLTENLQKSNADLERFAYVASHDMQEPLRKIQAFTDTLQHALKAGDKKEADYSISVVVDSAQRARHLVNSVLSYSLVQQAELALGQLDIAPEIESVVEQECIGRDGKRTDIAIDLEPASVRADPGQFVMLFSNLVGNAVKYRRNGVEPKITVQGRFQGDAYVVSVQDNGVGFDPTQATSVLEPFKRLHARSEFPGSGIGLAICDAVCERHGWKIEIETAPGKGSTFSVVMKNAVRGGLESRAG